MNLKSFLGKYKVKDVTEYLKEIEARHFEETNALKEQIEK